MNVPAGGMSVGEKDGKALFPHIVAVRRLPDDQRYRIRFLSNASLHWQKRSLHAISYFGGDLITIENL